MYNMWCVVSPMKWSTKKQYYINNRRWREAKKKKIKECVTKHFTKNPQRKNNNTTSRCLMFHYYYFLSCIRVFFFLMYSFYHHYLFYFIQKGTIAVLFSFTSVVFILFMTQNSSLIYLKNPLDSIIHKSIHSKTKKKLFDSNFEVERK